MATRFRGSAEQERSLDLFVKLVRAAATVERRTSQAITDAGLTTGQFGALETLYHLGPMPASKLAHKHLKSPNNFTVVLGNLEKLGLVRRDRTEADRRLVLVSLTDEGRARVEEILPDYVRAIVDDLSVLRPQEQTRLAELLRALGTGTPTAQPPPKSPRQQ